MLISLNPSDPPPPPDNSVRNIFITNRGLLEYEGWIVETTDESGVFPKETTDCVDTIDWRETRSVSAPPGGEARYSIRPNH